MIYLLIHLLMTIITVSKIADKNTTINFHVQAFHRSFILSQWLAWKSKFGHESAANLCSKVAVMVYDLTNSESEFIGTYDMVQN